MFETRTATIVEVHNSEHECNTWKVNLCGHKITVMLHLNIQLWLQAAIVLCLLVNLKFIFSDTIIMTKLRGEALVTCKNLIIK